MMKKTGLDLYDNLSPEERRVAIRNARLYLQSLTPEQRAQNLDGWYSYVREQKRQYGDMITEREIANRLINEELPETVMAAIEEAEKNGRQDIAADLKRRRIGIDTFEIDLVDEDTGEPVP
jgi:hypothetical protein